MLHVEGNQWYFEGPHGKLEVPANDEVIKKLAMLMEGECEGLGAAAAARKFDYSPQRYYQLLHEFRQIRLFTPTLLSTAPRIS
jgi:hypothetical protein